MTNLSTKIKLYANREINFFKDVLLQDDGNGAYIKEWNLDIAQPTIAQLNSLESQANEVERVNKIKENRSKEYPDFKDYLDGIVKGDQSQIDKYIADCLAVKAKYPKVS
jgi:hypothetical protein